METTYWNGLPTVAERGTATVAPAPEFPQYWAQDLVGQVIYVVRVVLDDVNFGGGVIYLDDRNGEGWLKVTQGHGSPSHGHAEVAIAEGSFVPCVRPELPSQRTLICPECANGKCVNCTRFVLDADHDDAMVPCGCTHGR